ncbi:DUF4373 domain-containing protein [Spirosoma sp. BT702]|uniref:DUF4373 domain-containing protein n=1 Tax=Spirosoma profusum TaxID=2771354 RepID=A0A926Y0K8_9BACT|nr:Lin1244/Lin1753 domain-containing protein [Spirosoma profusum]MBD2704434.1 DUF4373 domain-containing protein [Spirosoma profusum]
MKYFLHDTNAFQDEKISELYMAFGYEGLGLFYTTLERLAAQEKPIKTVVLKKQLDVGRRLEKCWTFMESIGLLCTKNGETLSVRMLSYVETYEEKRKKDAERKSQQRDKQGVPKNVRKESRGSHNAKGKVNKDKVNKDNTNDADASSVPDLFEQFYDTYDKKVDRKKCQAKWGKLKPEDHKAILEHVPLYIKEHPDVNYRKNPLSYLNGAVWLDPIKPSSRPTEKEMVY